MSENAPHAKVVDLAFRSNDDEFQNVIRSWNEWNDRLQQEINNKSGRSELVRRRGVNLIARKPLTVDL